MLLRLQAQPDKEDNLGLPPLFYAAKDGNLTLVKALLAAGACRSITSPACWLRQANFVAEIQDPRIVKLLSVASTNCPSLLWLARNAFRRHAKQNTVKLARQLQLPLTLISFLDFADIDEDWFV